MRGTGTITGRPMRLAWAAAAAVGLALCAAPVAEAARKGMKMARFSLTVTGAQTNDWSLEHVRYDGCVDGDVLSKGSGRERLTFKTRRPVRLEAIGIGREAVLTAGNGGIPVRGAIERQGEFHTAQLSGGESGCGGTEDPTYPPAPDCGTRPWSGTVDPVLYGPGDAPVADPVLQLRYVLGFTGPDLPEGRHPGELFANCPGADATLRATETAELTPRRLFSRKRRIVVTGRETVESDEDGHRERVTIAWRAVLKRRGKVRHVSGPRAAILRRAS